MQETQRGTTNRLCRCFGVSPLLGYNIISNSLFLRWARRRGPSCRAGAMQNRARSPVNSPKFNPTTAKLRQAGPGQQPRARVASEKAGEETRGYQ